VFIRFWALHVCSIQHIYPIEADQTNQHRNSSDSRSRTLIGAKPRLVPLIGMWLFGPDWLRSIFRIAIELI